MISKQIKETKCYQYAQSVLSGKQIACKYIIQACDRFMRDLERDDLIFDLESVDQVTHFFEKILYVPELRKAVPMPLFHAFWVQQLYGFKYKSTGYRRFTSVYDQFARKSAKTYYAAGITHFEALLGNDPNAEIMHGANTRDQALLCTTMAGKLIKSSPELLALQISQRESQNKDGIVRFEYKKNTTKIVYQFEDRFCTVEAQPKDPGDGGNPSVGIVDEYHEAKDDSLLETIKSGQGLRLEPLTIVITSPGHNKQGPCYQTLRKKSVDVLSGVIEDDRHLAIMFELDSEDEWDNIDLKKLRAGDLSVINVLEKSNPMIPYKPTLKSYLKDRVLQASTEGGSTAANIKIKNAGIWIDAPTVWIESKIIRENNHGITDVDLIGRLCYAGLDLSAGKDLNAFTLLFPNVKGKHVVKTMFWIPMDKCEKPREDGVDYRKWVEKGFLKTFPGNVVEYNVIAREIYEECEKYDLQSLGADSKYLYTGPVATWNEIDPSFIEKIEAVSQSYTGLSGATRQIENWTAKNEMDFMGNEVLFWNFQNVTMTIGKSGDQYPSKGESANKIDGVSSLCTATAQYLIHHVDEKVKPSVIEIWN